jgi:hypothetical protein
MRKLFSRISAIGASALIPLALPFSAIAAGSQVIVTPSNTQGWSTADTRPGGTVSYSMDTTAPGDPNNGALQLSTDASATAKAQYMHDTQTALSQVNELSYSTKQISATFAQGDPSYQLGMCLNGLTGCAETSADGNFTTLVFEPYYNTTQGAVIPGDWQSWDVDSGLFWSSRTVTCSNGVVTGTPGGPATYTLSQIQSLCPNALVVGFGVNVGSNNPGYNVEADLVNFNGTNYNFDPFKSVTNKDQCKDNGWMTATDDQGGSFKNQGQCVSWANHHNGQGNDDNKNQNNTRTGTF